MKDLPEKHPRSCIRKSVCHHEPVLPILRRGIQSLGSRRPANYTYSQEDYIKDIKADF